LFYTLVVVGLILGYMWIVVPFFGSAAEMSTLLILSLLGLCAYGNFRLGGCWGFRRCDLAPGLRWALWLTVPAVALVLAAGLALGTVQMKDRLALRFALLLVWALAQQFVLQTVIYREARERFSRGAAVLVAATLFAVIHLPNPFLTPATFVAALGWCWLYERHQNLVPIALSHAAASLAAAVALGPGITGGMRVGYGYFLAHGIWW
jgi:membrane protease YdiL (CAAX protease family)